jgi:hypothetical protein
MDYTAVGQTTHIAARVEQLAGPGSTLLSPATLDLVEGQKLIAASSVEPDLASDARSGLKSLGVNEPARLANATNAGGGRVTRRGERSSQPREEPKSQIAQPARARSSRAMVSRSARC